MKRLTKLKRERRLFESLKNLQTKNVRIMTPMASKIPTV